jgi:DNA-binding CsgD family transcriptional regulator
MATRITEQRISDLIGSVYDCAVDPSMWPTTLDAIRRELVFHNVALEVHALRAGGQTLFISAGFAPEWHARLRDYAADIIAMWGGPARIAQYPVEEPITLSQIAGPARLTSRYYVEWKQPQGLIDSVAVIFARDASMLGTVGFGHHQSAGAIKPRQLEALRLFAPHFRRAAVIGRLLEQQRIEAETFAAVLDRLASGIIFVDARMRIVHANRPAEAMAAAQDLLAAGPAGLRLYDEVAHGQLVAAISVATTCESKLGRRGIGIPARARSGAAAVIHVLPLRTGPTRAWLVASAVAALFIATGEPATGVPADALATLYELTPAETRIMELLADGCDTGEIGLRLGIATATIRTHLLRLFAKTRCNRRIDLVNLMRSFRGPA